MLAVPTQSNSSVESFRVSLTTESVGPGGVVSGHLTFRVATPKPFHRVSIKIVGKESASIHKDESSSGVATAYSAHSNVHKEHITLLGGIKGSDFNGNLPPGRYSYPFSFVIPSNAPPTIHPVARGEADDGGHLVWYIKAKIDTTPTTSDVEDVAVFTILTPMPVSQYKMCSTLSSPPHRARRSRCCCDQGVTIIQMNLAQNMLVFGIDKTLDGYITIDNHESKEGTANVLLTLSRMCRIKVGDYETITSKRLSGVTVVTGMKGGDDEKRFNFSIPLKSSLSSSSSISNNTGSTFRGRILSHYYQLTAVSDGEVIFTAPIVVGSGLDKSNSCPAIITDRPGLLVAAKQYPQYVYAPPPSGGHVSYPSAAASLMTKQTREVPPFEFVSPHHLST